MWSDSETTEDLLGYSVYASTLAQICLRDDISPLSLGIFGSWGSGKSSLMRMIKAEIDSGKSGASNKTRTIWINAWRYQGKDEIQSALISAIIQNLGKCQTVTESAKKLLKSLIESANVIRLAKYITKSVITLSPDINGLLKCFDEGPGKLPETMEEFENTFTKLLEEIAIRRLVIFIDDLDRCQNEEVINAFETIKLFLNFPQCTIVIGADFQKIQKAIREIFPNTEADAPQFAQDYLEKIIQLPFQIPVQRQIDIHVYIAILLLTPCVDIKSRSSLNEFGRTLAQDPDNLRDRLDEWINQSSSCVDQSCEEYSIFESVFPHATTVAEGLKRNPRQIKRFLNILVLRKELAAKRQLEISAPILVKTLVLEYRWPDFFRVLCESLDAATGQSPLLAEILNALDKQVNRTEISENAENALSMPGLADFLVAPPRLDVVKDLLPYALLAKMAVSKEIQTPTLRSASSSLLDELSDPSIYEIAVRRILNHGPETVETVGNALVSRVEAENDSLRILSLLSGFRKICNQFPEQYPNLLRAAEVVKVDEDYVPLRMTIQRIKKEADRYQTENRS